MNTILLFKGFYYEAVHKVPITSPLKGSCCSIMSDKSGVIRCVVQVIIQIWRFRETDKTRTSKAISPETTNDNQTIQTAQVCVFNKTYWSRQEEASEWMMCFWQTLFLPLEKKTDEIYRTHSVFLLFPRTHLMTLNAKYVLTEQIYDIKAFRFYCPCSFVIRS